ncbi:hypothetical protein JKF63_06380 [Porcisia hertigi]|uniref:non-specific serine/threonine protein kinase n=1 Tax=Porcisia hertigi TaxID=2761500 RepID=A0A836LJU4_9TRYP|nr:hypothetical protein JKF63_06380 [Porcisia hertigi]
MGMEHYTKVKDLGGTNGAFLARDRQQPNRLVVIKRLEEGTQGIEELNAALRLRHRHIIRFLESFVHESSLFVVMSYEAGGDLDELFRYLAQRRKAPTTHTLLLWFMQLLDALVYCHDNHVIHRDIKPSNILVSEDTKMLYLGDFGSAKTLSTSDVTSTFVGSPMWVSPEVLLGTSYSYAADVWSMGCVFYEMATLRKPFSAPSFAHLVQEITWGHIIPLPSHVAEVVQSIIYSMLVLDPAQRVTAKAALSVVRNAFDRVEQVSRALPSPALSPATPSVSSAMSSPVPAAAAPEVTADKPPQPHPLPPTSCPLVSATLPPMDDDTKAAASYVPGPSPLATPPLASASGKPQIKVKEAKAGEDPTPHGTPFTPTPSVQESLSHVAVVKRRPGSILSPSSSPQTKTSSPAVTLVKESAAPKQQPPAAKKAVVVKGKGGGQEKAALVEGVEGGRLQPSPPQQVVLQISTSGFRKPARPKKVTAGKAASPPRQQRVPSVPAQTVSPAEAPDSTRHHTADSPAPRRAPAIAAVVHTKAADLLALPRGSSRLTNVVKKAVPPTHVAKRALAAAANQESPPRVPKQSPTRAARGPSTPQQKQTPTVSPKLTADTAVAAPADQWFDQRMRDLCAMENYLHQHRVDDNKVLQTYDARQHEEGNRHGSVVATRGAAKPSPGPRGCRPVNKPVNAAPSPGVLVMTPPRRRLPTEDIPVPPAQQQQPGAVSPFAKQASYVRQISNHHRGSSSRQNSLSSTYSGHQASNARARPPASLDEQLKAEKKRLVVREKREAERQRMKELISAQRAAAKKEKRKAKKVGAVDVEIVFPDHRHHTATGAAPAD